MLLVAYLIQALSGQHSGKVVLITEAAAPSSPVIVPCIRAVLLKHLQPIRSVESMPVMPFTAQSNESDIDAA